MSDTENIPVKNTVKSREIARLTTPLTLEQGTAYDDYGDPVECIETFTEFRYYMEPKAGILSEDEILKYARNSKAAAQIRLERGIGSFQDKYHLNQDLPWLFGAYYVVLMCLSIPIFYYAAGISLFSMAILAVVPIFYVIYVFFLKGYSYEYSQNQISQKTTDKILQNGNIFKRSNDDDGQGIPSLKGYETKINDLSALFDGKEKTVSELIEKRFEPPQMTYDRFMSSVNACHKIFYTHADSALNIVHFAVDDTPRIRRELDVKIESLQSIIDQLEDLTNELVININSDENSNEDLKNVLNDMEKLIDSVKDYEN